ncbi:MAG: OmpA family protein [Acidobacteria bacterium]|nr:OmpA family protein [Acidobacteriota bacterium]
MSDSKKVPSLPPDDFSKTVPNIPTPDSGGSSDWEKTNYNAKFAPQPPVDDWGKTAANIPPIKDEPDFNKTYMPAPGAKSPDWGVTDANIRLPDHDFSEEQNFAKTNYGATSPFIHLPEAERAKYQNLPPTPTQAAEQKKEEEEKKGGVPKWFWAAAGLLSMFFFALIVIFLVYFFFLRPTGFEIVIQSAPPRSEVWVDNTRWSVTEGDGTLRAKGLKANELKKIEIRHPNYTCDARDIEGKDGETVTITAHCTQTGGFSQPSPSTKPNVDPNDCVKGIKMGEIEEAEGCANSKLDALPAAPNFTSDQLVDALNIAIINFDKDKYNIPSQRMKFLQRAAEFMMKLPDTTQIEVGGHTDDRNTDDYNMKLSINRANAVRDQLIKFGVKPGMLVAKGYGENSPKFPNNSEENRFFNRRIEYKVLRR